ncbi:hypothetical protein ACFXPX_04560 [Kitasatospora sp. NPDC059146]|uniref:hypothetical protein n=1 Tax=unclassified Kitasatospora TaxID=2633591 RepID=UPI00368B5E3D
MIWKNEIGLGDLIALAAIVLAMRQLVTSRRDLVAERRADFYLGELMAISIAMGPVPEAFLKSRDLALRLAVLPEHHLLLMRELAQDETGAALARVNDEMNAASGSPSVDWQDYLRGRCMDDVEAAVADVLETTNRPGPLRRLWKWACGHVRRLWNWARSHVRRSRGQA